MSRKVVWGLMLAAAGAALAAWLVHRATLGRTLEFLRRDDLSSGLRAGRDAAQDAFRMREAAGQPTEEVRAGAQAIDRALLVVEELDVLRKEMALSIALTSLVPSLLLLLALFALAWLWVRAVLRPIEAITGAVHRYTAGDTGGFPLTLRGEADVGLLRDALNGMVSTLDEQKLAIATQNRFVAWREVAVEVSHEMKNLLTPVRLASEGLMERAVTEADGSLKAGTEPILKALASLQRMVASLGDLSRRRPPTLAPVPARALLDECAAVHRPRGLVIDVEVEGAPEALADRELLGEAVANLVVNSAEARAQRITLRAREVGAEVELECRDDGEGIPAEHLARVRKLAFTTKTGGSGFGLYFADKLASQLGGSLSIQSSPGAGTCIRMVIPNADPAGR